MDNDRFEAGLGKVIADMGPADVESVANWPVVKALIVVALVSAVVGVTAILAAPHVPAWLADAAVGLEMICGVGGILFLHYRWLGRSGTRRRH